MTDRDVLKKTEQQLRALASSLLIQADGLATLLTKTPPPTDTLMSRRALMEQLGISKPQLDHLVVCGVLQPVTGSKYAAADLVRVQTFLRDHPESLKPAHFGNEVPERHLWDIITTPVRDPSDHKPLVVLIEKTGRTVGAIQAIKVSALNFEEGQAHRFANPRVVSAIQEIRRLQAEPDAVAPAWKHTLARRYDAETCARRWAIRS